MMAMNMHLYKGKNNSSCFYIKFFKNHTVWKIHTCFVLTYHTYVVVQQFQGVLKQQYLDIKRNKSVYFSTYLKYIAALIPLTKFNFRLGHMFTFIFQIRYVFF